MAAVNKYIINFTPTGMIPTKNQTNFVPISRREIVEDVKKACELGITMVHLHIRDEATQQPDYKKEIYADIIRDIRGFAPDLIICVSTSGRACAEYDKRADVLRLEGDLKPDMASLTLSSLNFNNQASINEPVLIVRLGEEMLRRGIKPELEAFDAGMINYAKYLIKKNILTPPYYFNLICGNIACAQADLLHVGIMIRDLPEESIFSLGGVGDYQLPINSLAVTMGYGVRVGLEDNIWMDRNRTRLATNIGLIRRIKEIALANEMQTMSCSELRMLLNLKKGSGEYGMVSNSAGIECG
jgi:3-keto-5-aminohexanoate cleavage enzyme